MQAFKTFRRIISSKSAGMITLIALAAVLTTTSVSADSVNESVKESVNINSANSEALAAAIDGVGEKLGAAIVEHRRRHGRFNNVEELVEVKGVGPKLVERNRSKLRVGAQAGKAIPTPTD